MNGRCLDCGLLVPGLSIEELEALDWSYFGSIMASGFERRNWRCGKCGNASVAAILQRIAKAAAERLALIEREAVAAG